jgi:hypothetical protein
MNLVSTKEIFYRVKNREKDSLSFQVDYTMKENIKKIKDAVKVLFMENLEELLFQEIGKITCQMVGVL